VQRMGVFLATLVGKALGGVFAVMGALRTRRRKALHPQGGVRQGLVVRQGCGARTGVAWIDEPGGDRVVLRLSRATGLPKFLPDVFGLALRVPCEGGGHGDLLLATTGTGAVGRFILRPTRRPGRPYGSLFPYRAPTGPLLLAAFPLSDDGTRFELACSALRGPGHGSGCWRCGRIGTMLSTLRCRSTLCSTRCRVCRATDGLLSCGDSPTPPPDELAVLFAGEAIESLRTASVVLSSLT
jgi:hypothetical protein